MKYYKLFLAIVIIGIILYAIPRVFAHAQSPEPVWTVSTPPTISELIDSYSIRYEISSRTLTNLLTCESKLNPAAIGDFGTSYGIAQIHLPAHPTITEKEALDPEWSIDWTAEQISTGHIGIWSCAKILGYS